MFFEIGENCLLARSGNERIRIEGWGENALRVRATQNEKFSEGEKALEKAPFSAAKAKILENGAEIVHGNLRCFVHQNGWMAFFRGETLLLKEYYRDFSGANAHSPSLKLRAREYEPHGSDYRITLRFEAQEEKLFGMGQYQQPE